MTNRLRIGFLPLVDACLPILAHEHGFAEEEGLELTFLRDVSWATVMDRLLYGHSDAAHMLAPLAIAASLGRGRPAQPLAAPFVLGLNGNAVTISNALADALETSGELEGPKSLGERLKRVAQERRAAGKPLRFGVVHRYSTHNYMLRYWLASCGIKPDEDVEIVTVAPPFSADAMDAGEIDSSCVGEPWNSIAVEKGVGQIVLATAQIWRRGVEKVLALREERLEEIQPSVEGLIRAMRRAGEHFVDPENWDTNAAILSRPEYCDASHQLVRRAISDRLVLRQGKASREYPDFMFQYHEAANFPWVSQAEWLYSQLVRWDGMEYDADHAKAASRVFRPDVYRSALKDTDNPLPTANSKVEGSVSEALEASVQGGTILLENNTFFDGESFDPDLLEGYINSQK
ncbi:MAG: CmpA/NrtA family ABC transporter substrate-binding protein [Erythrobacter sp.]|uniref:CmpA/NrtA family ABC transporter substrate-binding protein n=1 Tax=Erythrobacter sp. TaxID=1042 RepID=UPI003266CF3F